LETLARESFVDVLAGYDTFNLSSEQKETSFLERVVSVLTVFLRCWKVRVAGKVRD
jgi:hypothetical protein